MVKLAYLAIAVICIALLTVAVMRKHEAFTETKHTKYVKYVAEFKDMIPADVTVTKANALAIVRIVHETEAKGVRNPNAKRLHNAAIQQLREKIIALFGAADSIPGSVLLKL